MLPKHKLQAALDRGNVRGRLAGRDRRCRTIAGLGPFVLTEHVSGPAPRLHAQSRTTGARTRPASSCRTSTRSTVVIVGDQNTEAVRMQSGEIDLMASGDIRPEDYVGLQAARRPGRRSGWSTPGSAWIRTCCGSTCRPRRGRSAQRLAAAARRSARRCPARSIATRSSTPCTSAPRCRSTARSRRATAPGIRARPPRVRARCRARRGSSLPRRPHRSQRRRHARGRVGRAGAVSRSSRSRGTRSASAPSRCSRNSCARPASWST